MNLLLLPGLDGTGRLSGPFLRAWGDGARVHAHPAGEGSYAALTALARRALPDGPWVLVGESFSGPMAVRLAAERPPGLLALVLCASFVTAPVPVPAWLVRSAWVRATPRRAVRWALIEDRDVAVTRAEVDRALADVPPDVVARRFRELLSADVRPELAQVACPVLYLRGTRDRVVPFRAWEVVARARPDARRVDLPTPHGVLQVAPLEAAAAIRAFVV